LKYLQMQQNMPLQPPLLQNQSLMIPPSQNPVNSASINQSSSSSMNQSIQASPSSSPRLISPSPRQHQLPTPPNPHSLTNTPNMKRQRSPSPNTAQNQQQTPPNLQTYQAWLQSITSRGPTGPNTTNNFQSMTMNATSPPPNIVSLQQSYQNMLTNSGKKQRPGNSQTPVNQFQQQQMPQQQQQSPIHQQQRPHSQNPHQNPSQQQQQHSAFSSYLNNACPNNNQNNQMNNRSSITSSAVGLGFPSPNNKSQQNMLPLNMTRSRSPQMPQMNNPAAGMNLPPHLSQNNMQAYLNMLHQQQMSGGGPGVPGLPSGFSNLPPQVMSAAVAAAAAAAALTSSSGPSQNNPVQLFHPGLPPMGPNQPGGNGGGGSSGGGIMTGFPIRSNPNNNPPHF
jgi:hypothetical protein